MTTRVAVVTGGASGIGAAVATALAAEGARVAILDVDEAGALARAGAIGGLGIGVDVRDEPGVVAAVERVTAELGPPRVLVHCAGVVGGFGPLRTLPVEALTTVLEVNVRGTFVVTKVVANAMVAAGRGGAILHLSSAGALQPTAGLGHYEASKAAVNALTRSAALELAAYGIRVNAVAPGPVATPMTAAGLADPAAREVWVSRIPLGRIASTDDLVPQILLLVSDRARHITGTVLAIDGGQLLKG